MTARTVDRGRRPGIAVVPVLVAYTLRACLPAKRRVGMLLPCAAALLFGLIGRAHDGFPPDVFAHVAEVGLFGVVLPIGCLVVGDAVLGAEVRAGVLHYTWLSPVSLTAVVVARWIAGFLISLVTVVLACALAAVVAGVPDGFGPMLVSAGAAAAAYIGLFVMIGCATRRAAVWSLAAVLLVEDLLGAALAGIAQLSPAWQGRAAYAVLGPGAEGILRSGIPSGWGAVVRLGVITVVTLALASWRLRHLRLTGPED